MQTILEQLSKKLESVDTQLQDMKTLPRAQPQTPAKIHPEKTSGGDKEGPTPEENTVYLCKLDNDQVCVYMATS